MTGFTTPVCREAIRNWSNLVFTSTYPSLSADSSCLSPASSSSSPSSGPAGRSRSSSSGSGSSGDTFDSLPLFDFEDSEDGSPASSSPSSPLLETHHNEASGSYRIGGSAGDYSKGLGIFFPGATSLLSFESLPPQYDKGRGSDANSGEAVRKQGRSNAFLDQPATASKQAPCDTFFCFPKSPYTNVGDTFSVEHYHTFDISPAFHQDSHSASANENDHHQTFSFDLNDTNDLAYLPVPPTPLKRSCIDLPAVDTPTLPPPPVYDRGHSFLPNDPSAPLADDATPALLHLHGRLEYLKRA